MTKFSEDIEELLKERFEGMKPLEEMDLKELKDFRDEVENLRHEYFLLEIAQKTLGNAAYGACANQYFYFFNLALAGDITGECRALTQTMWKDLEHFFHETLWERKDLQQQFGFELDESKHEWYRGQPVSIYSDTDSQFNTFLHILTTSNQTKDIMFEELFKKCFDEHGLMDLTKNGQEIVKCDYKMLNWTKDKGLHFAPVKYIMRHKVNKECFKIRTKSGKEIKVTGDHSCVVFRHGKQLTIKARDINKDTDKILSITYEK